LISALGALISSPLEVTANVLMPKSIPIASLRSGNGLTLSVSTKIDA